MTTRSVFRLAILAAALVAPLAACIPGGAAPYDRSDQYKSSNGTEPMGAPGSGARD